MPKRKKTTSKGTRRRAAASRRDDPQPTSLALPPECLVTQASSLKASLAALVDQPLTVSLDATAVQRIDTAALQVITAFVRERAGNGRAVRWRGSAPVVAGAAQLLGLTSALELPP